LVEALLLWLKPCKDSLSFVAVKFPKLLYLHPLLRDVLFKDNFSGA